METTVTNQQTGEQIAVDLYFSIRQMGRGGYNIVCEFESNGKSDETTCYITDSQFFDDVREIDDYDEKQAALKNRCWTTIEQRLAEMCTKMAQKEYLVTVDGNYVGRNDEIFKLYHNGIIFDKEEAEEVVSRMKVKYPDSVIETEEAE